MLHSSSRFPNSLVPRDSRRTQRSSGARGRPHAGGTRVPGLALADYVPVYRYSKCRGTSTKDTGTIPAPEVLPRPGGAAADVPLGRGQPGRVHRGAPRVGERHDAPLPSARAVLPTRGVCVGMYVKNMADFEMAV